MIVLPSQRKDFLCPPFSVTLHKPTGNASHEGGLLYAQAFDAKNSLISVTVSGETTRFLYDGDGDGNLVKKIEPDLSSTIYVGGVYEVKKNSGGSVTKRTTYYPAAGAMRVQEGSNNNVYYVLKDHLGSASVVTDASGNVVGEQRFYLSP